LSQAAQVLCITHLPQIAAHARTQLRVTKAVRKGRTTTQVAVLDHGRRCEEIARMMAGGSVTDAVLSSAAEMLAARQAKGETKAKAKAKVEG
jgi:DNA repair protein RecN (Recombination protein N)